MSLADDKLRHYRVPQESGKALIDPSLATILENLNTIDAKPTFAGLEFCGKPIDFVRSEARQESIELAKEFTSRYSNLPSSHSSLTVQQAPLLLTGHQPELFHPGVWFKNFLVSRLADACGGTAINFLVDNDLCRNASIRVPSRNPDGSVIANSIEFDAPRDSIPWEHRQLNDSNRFQQFPFEVRRSLLPEVKQPIVEQLWQYALEAIARNNRIGFALAEARHRLEINNGLNTLEVPLSQLSNTRSFARFSIQLLSELPRLQACYNRQREIYRAAHSIRSQAHPVPELEQQHGWLEAPWWVYRPEAPKRQRLWVRMVDDALILSDQAGWQAVIEGRLDCDNAATQWLELLSDGVCLRPRALLTTMYMRLIVGDTFVHGIGGGKYDQLTDAIVHEFFGIRPPDFIVASATMRLPVEPPKIEMTSDQVQRRMWQLKHQPDRVVELSQQSNEYQQLAARKRELLANIPPRGDKWKWHREITSVNRQLSELSRDAIADSQQQLEQTNYLDRQKRILHSREYSFCLFDGDVLIPELKRLASGQ